MRKNLSGIAILGILLIIVITLISSISDSEDLKMSYSEMMDAIKNDQVQSIELSTESGKASVQIKNTKTPKEVNIPSIQEFTNYIQEQKLAGATFEFKEKGTSMLTTFIQYISPIGMIIILILFWVFLLQQQGGGKAMSFGKSRARLQTDEDKKITFKNVAGVKEEKEDERKSE